MHVDSTVYFGEVWILLFQLFHQPSDIGKIQNISDVLRRLRRNILQYIVFVLTKREGNSRWRDGQHSDSNEALLDGLRI